MDGSRLERNRRLLLVAGVKVLYPQLRAVVLHVIFFEVGGGVNLFDLCLGGLPAGLFGEGGPVGFFFGLFFFPLLLEFLEFGGDPVLREGEIIFFTQAANLFVEGELLKYL